MIPEPGGDEGGIQHVKDIQLGDAGGHGAVMEGGRIVGGIEPVVGQFRHRGGGAPGDGDDGGAVFPEGPHGLDDLRRLAGKGDHDGHVLGGGIFGLEQLGGPVIVDDAGLVQPEEFQIGVPRGIQGRTLAEEQHCPGVLQQLHAGVQRFCVQQVFAVLQGEDVLVGDLFHNVLHGIGGRYFPGGLARLAEAPHRHLAGNSLTEFLVAGKADALAHADDGGGGGEGFFRQLVDAQPHGLALVGQKIIGDSPLRGAHGILGLPQLQQCAFHIFLSSPPAPAGDAAYRDSPQGRINPAGNNRMYSLLRGGPATAAEINKSPCRQDVPVRVALCRKWDFA